MGAIGLLKKQVECGGLESRLSYSDPWAPLRSRRFEINDEIRVRGRAPHIDGVFCWIVPRFPFDIGGDEVDVERIFGPAFPGIANVVEVIGTQDMATYTPSLAVPVGLMRPTLSTTPTLSFIAPSPYLNATDTPTRKVRL